MLAWLWSPGWLLSGCWRRLGVLIEDSRLRRSGYSLFYSDTHISIVEERVSLQRCATNIAQPQPRTPRSQHIKHLIDVIPPLAPTPPSPSHHRPPSINTPPRNASTRPPHRPPRSHRRLPLAQPLHHHPHRLHCLLPQLPRRAGCARAVQAPVRCAPDDDSSLSRPPCDAAESGADV